jgi:signal transduction histidine kinase
MEYRMGKWDEQLDRVVVWLLWITLIVGVFAVFVRDGATHTSFAATAVAGAYVLASTVLPSGISRRRLVRELIVLVGAIATMTAVTLTGALTSPFLLLGLMPVLFSGVRGGFRDGIGAAALSSGILASVVIPADDPAWLDLIRWSFLLFLVAGTFGYAHRLLSEEGARSDAIAAASAETSARLERLETAHRLLTRLSARAETAEFNPIDVGNAALDSVRGVVPFTVASISISSDAGLVAVARSGEPVGATHQTSFLMEAGGRQVGILIVGTERELNRSQRDAIEAVLQPASLAFSNVLLLQGIARTAIREERTRLARELHDEIGPSLASLGLALDLAAIQYPTEPALGAHLKKLRNEVAVVVEDVRSAVTDLRADDEEPTIRETVRSVMRSRDGDSPSIMFHVDERRPARPSIAPHVNAIVTEALRNAITHAQSSTITINGFVDFAAGALEIRDNGRGFDLNTVDERRYGLVGMRERAHSIGAKLRIDSNETETTVSLSWGTK